MQHAIAAVPARDWGRDQPSSSTAVLLGICEARSLGGHPKRRSFWSKEDAVVKKQLPPLPSHPAPITWHHGTPNAVSSTAALGSRGNSVD